jgi:hypothetical protein
MKKYAVGLLVLGLLVCSFSGVSRAQAEDETDYSFGVLKSASASEVVVTEYDYEQDKDIDVTYAVDPKVKLENADAVQNIAVGSNVEIDFVTKDSKKTAVAISVEKAVEEAAVVPAEPAPTVEPPKI